MLTAIIKPSYSLCLILFDIDLLFLVSSHINVEQFLGPYVGWLQNSMIRKNNALEKVDLGQKTGMLNYRKKCFGYAHSCRSPFFVSTPKISSRDLL